MKTLIGMREFVLLEFSKRNPYYYQDSKVLNRINNYANFLLRQTQLSDFVPCGEDGVPLTEPTFYYTEDSLKELKGIELDVALSVNEKVKEYKEALDRILFKGFKICRRNERMDCVYNEELDLHISTKFDKTLESLTPYNLELTENANKIIGV